MIFVQRKCQSSFESHLHIHEVLLDPISLSTRKNVFYVRGLSSQLLCTFDNLLVHVMRIKTLCTSGAKFPSGNDMRDIKNMHLDEMTLKSRVVQI